jgi:WD40 repeat protein
MVGKGMSLQSQADQAQIASWNGHQGSISAIAYISAGQLGGHVVSGASDGMLRIWRQDGELVQEIDLKGRLPLDVEVASLPGSEGMFRMDQLTQSPS